MGLERVGRAGKGDARAINASTRLQRSTQVWRPSAMQGVDDQAGGDLHKQILRIGLSNPTMTTAGITQVVVGVIVYPVASVHFGPGQAVTTTPRLLLPSRRWRLAVMWSTGVGGGTIAPCVVRWVGPGGGNGQRGCGGQRDAKQTSGFHIDLQAQPQHAASWHGI